MAQLSPADPIVILSYARTPMGAMQGALSDVAATDLGATAIKAAVERAGVDGAEIERVYMGCVLPAGLGLLWALVDEESLTWQDHISHTFPTPIAYE